MTKNKHYPHNLFLKIYNSYRPCVKNHVYLEPMMTNIRVINTILLFSTFLKYYIYSTSIFFLFPIIFVTSKKKVESTE